MRYELNTSIPISIFPNGKQPASVVTNVGTVNVFLNDIANNMGTALVPGAQRMWAAGRPLYAYVDAGYVSAITVDTTANVDAMTGVYATVADSSSNLSCPRLWNGPLVAFPGVNPLIDVSMVESIRIAFHPTYGAHVTTARTMMIEWYPSVGNMTFIEDVQFSERMPQGVYYLTLPCRGASLRIVTLFALEYCTIVGIPQQYEARYLMPGIINGVAKYNACVPGVIADATDFIWYPETWDGLANITSYFQTAVIGASGVYFLVETAGTLDIMMRKWYALMADLYQINVTVRLPRTPCRIRIANRAGAALTCTSLTIAYE